jgi:hypothetical protein
MSMDWHTEHDLEIAYREDWEPVSICHTCDVVIERKD